MLATHFARVCGLVALAGCGARSELLAPDDAAVPDGDPPRAPCTWRAEAPTRIASLPWVTDQGDAVVVDGAVRVSWSSAFDDDSERAGTFVARLDASGRIEGEPLRVALPPPSSQANFLFMSAGFERWGGLLHGRDGCRFVGFAADGSLAVPPRDLAVFPCSTVLATPAGYVVLTLTDSRSPRYVLVDADGAVARTGELLDRSAGSVGYWDHAAFANGSFVGAWSLAYGSVEARTVVGRFDSNGDPLGTPVETPLTSGEIAAPQVATDGERGLIVWQHERYEDPMNRARFTVTPVDVAGRVGATVALELPGTPANYLHGLTAAHGDFLLAYVDGESPSRLQFQALDAEGRARGATLMLDRAFRGDRVRLVPTAEGALAVYERTIIEQDRHELITTRVVCER